MKSNKSRLIISIVFSLGTFCIISMQILQAQDRPDFTGNWQLDETKSNMGEGNFRRGASSMTVRQDDHLINIERVSQNRNGEEMQVSEKVTLDGKETDNSVDGRVRKSTARWAADGKSLTINTHLEFSRDGNTLTFDIVEIWKLQDVNTLNIGYTSHSSRGDQIRKFVYNKM
jgi:hypothetical protein